jgi:hypothetical protein
MTYRELLEYLTALGESDLEKTVQVLVTGQALVIHRIDEGDGDDPPMLDTGIHLVDPMGACD